METPYRVVTPIRQSWEVRLLAGAAIGVLIVIIPLLGFAALVTGWFAIYASGSLFGLVH